MGKKNPKGFENQGTKGEQGNALIRPSCSKRKKGSQGKQKEKSGGNNVWHLPEGKRERVK